VAASRPDPAAGGAGRILILGGASEIALAILAALDPPAGTEVLLAGRDSPRLATAAAGLKWPATTLPFDATAVATHRELIDKAFAGGPVDLVISAAGVLIPQPVLDRDPLQAATLIETNLTGLVTTLLAAAARLRGQRRGTIVVLSSVAAVRPRRANYVYGAAKAGLDAFARGLADALHGSGVRVLLVRPGFVTGRMTAGMSPAPLATTPEAVGQAVAAALRGRSGQVWVPRQLGPLAALLRLVPRPAWRRISR
jgi:decaprenylphospho-beta-D-erythro-pentofuranosid-2-ulose 2-reductase